VNLLRKARTLRSKFSALKRADQASDPVREKYIRRERYIITDLISETLPARERLIILEGGAADSFRDPRWQAFDNSRKRLYGFEPNQAECARLNEEAKSLGLDYQFFPVGLWSSTARLALYENKAASGNSFFPQNVTLTNRWKFENSKEKYYAKDIFYPLGTTSEWNVTSVHEWLQQNGIPPDIDFMKLNVQGAELEILKGAERVLESVTGLQVEMSFVESYLGRPYFADIDIFLRNHSFYFFDFIGHHCMGRKESPITVQNAPGLYPLLGQLIEGHGVYFKDPIDLHNRGNDVSQFSVEKLLKLVCFAEMYHQHEFALELLYWIARDFPPARHMSSSLQALADRAVETYRRYTGG
jgi:FkbM family methyltransferase